MRKYRYPFLILVLLVYSVALVAPVDRFNFAARVLMHHIRYNHLSHLIFPGSIVKPEILWGNRSKKLVIFTFDAGGTTQSAVDIVATLERHRIKSTFFITGAWASKNSTITDQIFKKGHEIYNHTYSHPYLTGLSDSQIQNELQKTEDAIVAITGKSTKPYFRPAYGDHNARVLEVAAKMGYQSVYWTVDAFDWKETVGYTTAQAKKRVLENLKPGTIYLMHIGNGISGQLLDELLTEIKTRGYTIVSLREGIQ